MIILRKLLQIIASIILIPILIVLAIPAIIISTICIFFGCVAILLWILFGLIFLIVIHILSEDGEIYKWFTQRQNSNG